MTGFFGRGDCPAHQGRPGPQEPAATGPDRVRPRPAAGNRQESRKAQVRFHARSPHQAHGPFARPHLRPRHGRRQRRVPLRHAPRRHVAADRRLDHAYRAARHSPGRQVVSCRGHATIPQSGAMRIYLDGRLVAQHGSDTLPPSPAATRCNATCRPAAAAGPIPSSSTAACSPSSRNRSASPTTPTGGPGAIATGGRTSATCITRCWPPATSR